MALQRILGTVAGTILFACTLHGGELEAPAPCNPYRGMQVRKEVYEFTQKPQVEKKGNGYVITFAVKDACDVTVAVVGPDGKILKHIGSGVLGKNAPYPFQQGSLSQRLEWDGKDDFGKPVPPGSKVRVSLGMKVVYERNMGYTPYAFSFGKKATVLFAEGEKAYYVGFTTRNASFCRAYDKKTGEYIETLCPFPAEEVTKSGFKTAETIWGDKVIRAGWFGPYAPARGKSLADRIRWVAARMKAMPGVKELKEIPRSALPEVIRNRMKTVPEGTIRVTGQIDGKCIRMAVDRSNDLVYLGSETMYRLNGANGKFDDGWFPKGQMSNVCEFSVGPDGCLYFRFSRWSYGWFIIRLDRNGKIVPFNDKYTVPIPPPYPPKGVLPYLEHRRREGKAWWIWRPAAFKAGPLRGLYTGVRGHSNTHQRGVYVSLNGRIVAGINEISTAWAIEHGIIPSSSPLAKKAELPTARDYTYAVIWENNGKMVTANAVGSTHNGHGVAMDVHGNLYVVYGQMLPAENGRRLYGLKNVTVSAREWGGFGSVVKFRYLGDDKYPLGAITRSRPEGKAVKMGYRYDAKGTCWIKGAEWAFGGITGQSYGNCTCMNQRGDLDYFARYWMPANHLYSVLVVDSNGNLMARVGAYGNVDDSRRDKEKGMDGMRFCWVRHVAVSDRAMYAADAGNRCIIKGAIRYAVEEEVPLPAR